MLAFLALFLLDLVVRRWENVLGVLDLFGRKQAA